MFDLPHTNAAGRAIAERYGAQKAERLRNEIVQQLSTPGTGRLYKRATRTHRASAPGHSPAVDTGRLRQSIQVVAMGQGRFRVGTNVVYALELEYGTSRLAPRPFMRAARARVDTA